MPASPTKTVADVLDEACAKYACRYERSVLYNGEVQVRLLRPDATLSCRGPNTAETVDAVVKKANSCWSNF